MGNQPSITENYSKVWQRTTRESEDIHSNPQRRTRFLPPLPGEQSGWRRVGVAAKYNPKQNMLTSGYRFVLEEQKFNNGYRYRIVDNEEIAPIRLGWLQTKVHNHQVLKANNYPEGTSVKSTELQRAPRFYKVALDMKTAFDVDYRPENIFGDMPMNESRYRKSGVEMPIRKQV